MAYSKGRVQVNIWPTEEEREVLKRRANAIGISLQTYCLNMALNGKIPYSILRQTAGASVSDSVEQHTAEK